jgi:hypothetical protein
VFAVVANAPNTNSYCNGLTQTANWEPFSIFRYKNLPAFSMRIGDTLAFDITDTIPFPTTMSDSNPLYKSVAFATPAEVYSTVVTQNCIGTPGNSIIGDFDLRLPISAPFTFLGGTLLIRMEKGIDIADCIAFNGGFAVDTSG